MPTLKWLKKKHLCLYCGSPNTKFDKMKMIVKCRKCKKRYRLEKYEFWDGVPIYFAVLLDKKS